MRIIHCPVYETYTSIQKKTVNDLAMTFMTTIFMNCLFAINLTDQLLNRLTSYNEPWMTSMTMLMNCYWNAWHHIMTAEDFNDNMKGPQKTCMVTITDHWMLLMAIYSDFQLFGFCLVSVGQVPAALTIGGSPTRKSAFIKKGRIGSENRKIVEEWAD